MKLHGRVRTTPAPLRILRLTTDRELAPVVRDRHALLVESHDASRDQDLGFAAVLARTGPETDADDAFRLPDELAYLGAEDVVRLDPRAGSLRVLYRRHSEHNALLVTERCNSRCLMCSQPPIPGDDRHLVEELLAAVPLMAKSTRYLGITGGEPTLLHDDLIRLVVAIRDHLPCAALHVLSNGRLFAYLRYAQKVAAVRHPDLMFGVPLYSDLAERHDLVVQARGAFDQTVRGLLNLGRCGVRVEVRVVLHRLTYERLPELARFLARNLTFVEHVALMGLEMTGYTRLNLEALWIDPHDYQEELARAVGILDRAGFRVSIYNHQLCVLDRELWPFARKSISDWKNEYMPECAPCSVRAECGGFFASAPLRYSAHIRPISPEPP